MLFIRNETFKQYIRLYPITFLFISINIVMFSYTWFTGGITTDHLYELGAMVTTPPQNGAEIWRWFTSIFLHGGGMHLLMNSFSLYVFAPPLERLLGKTTYFFFYLASGFIGSACSAYLSTQVAVSIGASGAVYGVLGAYLAIIMVAKFAMDFQSRQTVIVLIVIGAIGSFVMSDVNGLAHFGGFVGGFLLYLLWHNYRRFRLNSEG